ncbi:hypothetical protein ADN00_15785 [Ornatilinea apprima]|uniref:MPN domain-containing protein n=1 Tax=Ornatilinea apprima TaxID=1134406 RepID=A0A0N8GLE5_9CHLR|nr:DNA repair protein RadC [Ornatilinea apprima]KPL72274.1 hypothetical protein ADN00_15785 [Ornatilinea apprima]
MKYADLPKSEQPSHKIHEYGGKVLTPAELLALATFGMPSTSEKLGELYKEYGGLSRIPRHRILEIDGLGEKTADAIQAIVELTRREIVARKPDRVSIHCPQDAADLVMYEMSQLEVEQLRVILINTRNEVMRVVNLYQGTANSSNVRISEVFRDAIRENATGIILVHNHPSGNPDPSPEDVQLTRAAAESGKMLDIRVFDHIIVGANGTYRSLKEAGLGF